jgi:HD-GYP domain-containing protein (c-di-GMP phosphodiesterase class II)
MTSATLQLVSPTHTEIGLLRIAGRITAFVEHRIERRAQKRLIALDLLREQQTRKVDPRAVDLALAQLGLPLR